MAEKKEKKMSKKEMAQQEADAVEFTDEVYYDTKAESYPKLSRAAAVILGFRRYYTGESCVNGHDAPRKTKSAGCIVCTREKVAARRKERMANDPEYREVQLAKAKARRQAKKAA